MIVPFSEVAFQIVTNLLEGFFMHKLLAKHISCSTVDIISHIRAFVTSKIQEYTIHTAVVEIDRGRVFMHMFGKRLSFGRGKLSICGSNTEAKSF